MDLRDALEDYNNCVKYARVAQQEANFAIDSMIATQYDPFYKTFDNDEPTDVYIALANLRDALVTLDKCKRWFLEHAQTFPTYLDLRMEL